MQKNNWVLYIGALIVIVFIGFLVMMGKGGSTPRSADMDTFAMCLADKGAVFYGAFWCPHCAAQKALFGKSADKLPYVECSTPDSQGQTPICIEKSISNYPTWIFADGSKVTGERSLSELAQKTNCALPSTAAQSEASTNPIETGTSSPAGA